MMLFRLFYLEELCSRGNLSIVFWFERGAVVRDVPEHPVDFRAMSSIHKILRAVGRNARNDAHRQTEVPVCFIEQKKRGLRKNIKMHTKKWCWGQKRNTPGRIFQYMYTSDSMFTNVHPIPQEAHIVVNYARCAFGLKLFATRFARSATDNPADAASISKRAFSVVDKGFFGSSPSSSSPSTRC